jgi:hypothetical protein
MKIRTATFLLASLVLASACGRADRPQEDASTGTATPSSAAAPGDSATVRVPAESGSMQEMEAHMQMVRNAGADSLRAMLPMHRQMAANLLAQMNREMREMNMAADPAWTATADSLRQDLTRMPEMGADELRAMMPGHDARLTRLMEMHRAMMGKMGM